MAAHNNSPNWKQIKIEYVSSDISMKALAEKHGVNSSTLQTHARNEHWTKLRKQADERANEKLVREAARKKAKLMAKCLCVGYGLMQKVEDIAAKAKDMTSTKTRKETATSTHIDKLNIDVPVHAVTETDIVKLTVMYSTLMHTLGFDEASQIARDRLEVDRLRVEMHFESDKDMDERPVIVDSRPEPEESDDDE